MPFFKSKVNVPAKPFFKVVQVGNAEAMIVVYNTGTQSKNVGDAVTDRVIKTITSLSASAGQKASDYDGWLPLNDQVTFDGTVFVIDHNGTVVGTKDL